MQHLGVVLWFQGQSPGKPNLMNLVEGESFWKRTEASKDKEEEGVLQECGLGWRSAGVISTVECHTRSCLAVGPWSLLGWRLQPFRRGRSFAQCRAGGCRRDQKAMLPAAAGWASPQREGSMELQQHQWWPTLPTQNSISSQLQSCYKVE